MAINNIVLTGPRGVGKTTLLPLLADRLGLKPFRFDDLVLNHFAPGCQMDEFLFRPNAAHVLDHEAPKLLKSTLTNSSQIILELGSGAVTTLERQSATENLSTLRLLSKPILLLLYPDVESSVPILRKRLSPRRNPSDTPKMITLSYIRCLELPQRLPCMSFFEFDLPPSRVADIIAHAIENSSRNL